MTTPAELTDKFWKAIHADTGMQRVLAGYDVLYQDKSVSVLVRLERKPQGTPDD